ncbi:response regulator [Ideonella dechloratans]|uniref:Response regulator n=1 Tax=Ideonella dechloratans TaxID=36863 RepID=A0A643F9R2_IDEDE|nr:response regulator [Ideonella dechloratans]
MAQVLVVDDSSTVRNEVADFLQRNGLTVSTAVDGKDGLSKLRLDSGIKLVIWNIDFCSTMFRYVPQPPPTPCKPLNLGFAACQDAPLHHA